MTAAYRGLLLGPELEFFVVDRTTLSPRDGLGVLAGHPAFGTAIKPEIAREQVEIAPPPTASLHEMEATLTGLVREAEALLRVTDACLLPAALYDTASFTITEAPRYRRLLDVFGEGFGPTACSIVADQVNIGAGNERDAFRIFEAVTFYLPLYMGLSVASPFRKGHSNGTASNRMDCYDACAARYPDLVGLPPKIASLAHYNRLLQEQPTLRHPNMFYRYARPMPHRGVAAEIRCLDKQPTLRSFLAFVALSKAIAAEATASDRAYPREALDEQFRAARTHGVVSPEACRQTLDRLRGYLDEDEQPYLAPLYRRLDTGSAAEAMRARARGGGLSAVFHHLAAHYLDPDEL